MKIFTLSLVAFLFFSFDALQYNATDEKEQVNNTIDAWHKAAAEANFDAYFRIMAEDAIFIGTDPTENWNKTNFQAYAKPHFDKGKAWSFKAIERHVYFDTSGKTAWFDELLDTQMKICRGSGVLVKIGQEWKIKQYVLSMTIPNENTNDVIRIIAPIEDALIQKKISKE
jgi:ketosteroid isomerase-like protein